MAKNYASIYNSENDSYAIEQRWYAKLEAARGTLIAPAATDFFYALTGGSISYSQPFESSPHRSGRHNTSTIVKKKQTSWSLTTFFNIDEALGAPGVAEIDPAIRLLFKSVLGNEDVTGGSPVFNSALPPDLTFSLYEVGDRWARQARGSFVEAATLTFPGNGEATIAWSGNSRDAVMCGIAKSTTDNTANTVTVVSGDEDLIPVGALVMIIEADGVTRSADTPTGSARTVVSKAGNVITISGAPLTDADGSVLNTPIYLCYYEPSAPTAINNPVTGLVGSMSVASTTQDCFRQVVLALTNNHELEDYCYGTDALGDKVFVPGSRLDAAVTIEANLNRELIALFNRVVDFEAQDIELILGDSAGRHFKLEMPKVRFPVPAFAVPDTGSIPVSFQGTAYQTAEDAADEVTASFL